MREEGDRMRAKHIQSRIGQTDEALFEESGLGRLADFSLVKVGNPPPAGSFAKVELTGYDGENALGRVVNV